jgi:transcriptional regulator with XRE-family HTH domain
MVLIATTAQSVDMSNRGPYRKKTPKVPRHYIRAWREFRRLTQEQLAGRTDMSVPQISKIETGKRDYRQSTLEQFAEALNCSPADLLRPPEGPGNELAAFVMRLDDTRRQQALRILEAAMGSGDKSGRAA